MSVALVAARVEALMVSALEVKALIRAIPDYPKPGIVFRDMTPLFGDARAFAYVVDAMAAAFASDRIDVVVGVEARGFILGGALARALGAGFAPARKPGKLPWRTLSQAYALEYGADALEVHEDALAPGVRVLLADDLIATGGTALAALGLINRLGGAAIAASFVIDLPALGGADQLRQSGVRVESLFAF